MIRFLTDREIYEEVIQGLIPQSREFLWIGTSDLKDLYVSHKGRMIPFLGVLDELVRRRVSVRLIHAKEPGPAFRKDFDKYPMLWKNLERLCCPRIHFKTIVVDGRWAYTGSANLTGAGMGAKSDGRRNFENGILTDEPHWIEPIMEQFDTLWMGAHCKACQRKQYCGDQPV